MKPLITELTKARDIYIELDRRMLNPIDEYEFNAGFTNEK
jgi:hypothetical protein